MYVIVCDNIHTHIVKIELMLFEERRILRKKSTTSMSHSTFYCNKLKSVIFETKKMTQNLLALSQKNKLEIDSWS